MSGQTTFNADGIAKLKQIINEGASVLQEVETLNEGLNDTIKSLAEELDIKASVLKKAVKIAHKARLTEANEEHELLNEILVSAGRAV